MSTSRIFIVHLRRPKANDPRWDPFYEFGSFGCTGCHSHNLFKKGRKPPIRDSDRLAFIQGGPAGSRLVLLTPPVAVWFRPSGSDASVMEVRWDPESKPFAYRTAPLVAANSGDDEKTEFPKLRRRIESVNRGSAAGKLASRYRSSATGLDPELANEMLRVVRRAGRTGSVYKTTARYEETMAGNIEVKSRSERRRELARLRREAHSGANAGCRNTQRSQCR